MNCKKRSFSYTMLVEKSLHCFCLCLLICGALHVAPSAASTEYNRYLAHIFNKYGSGGTMSFEGLEHLMYSLGLGQIEFDPTHTIDEHRPEGYSHKNPENENKLKTYLEEQTLKLLDHDNDVQLAPAELQGNQRVASTSAIDAATVKTTDDNSQMSGRKLMLEFKEMHDPKHRHPRENDATFDLPPLTANVCLSPKSLLRLVVDHDDLHKRKLYKTVTKVHASGGDRDDTHDLEQEYNEFINNVKLTPVAFMKLCPALLAQIDQNVCMRAAPLMHGEDPKETLWNAWIYASGSIFVLSCCGLIGILLVPLMKTIAYQEILKFLVAVAVGTLSGDALMHLLPHALVSEHPDSPDERLHAASSPEAELHKHDNGPVWICGCAFLAACFMYIIENLLPLLKGDTKEGHIHGHSHTHGHSHNHGPNSPTTKPSVPVAPSNQQLAALTNLDAREINVMLNEQQRDEKTASRPLTPLAFMVVIGDGLHNLTDGLAIGAAFATDPVTGLATAFAVFCHELPHELGDFALLLQTGVSLRRAVCLNIVSSVLSFVGMAIGLLIAGVHTDMTRWIYAGTAGSFLYIAFADLLPAMSAEGKSDLKSNLVQILGILVGGAIMLLIALNEDHLEKLFK